MIGTDQYEHIRTAHRVYKKSIRQIARETGHHRRTIRHTFAIKLVATGVGSVTLQKSGRWES